MNRATILGNLGTDPEFRKTKNETPVCRFRVATTERRKDAQGIWSEFPEWHNVVAFRRTAENCMEYLKKGRQVFVDGSLRTRSWQDSEGQTRYATEIVASNVQFIGARLPGNATSVEGGGHGSGMVGQSTPPEAAPDLEEDDVPW